MCYGTEHGDDCYGSAGCTLVSPTECKEYWCKHHGAFECGRTNMMIDEPGIITCRGSIECATCFYMGVDGKTRMCDKMLHFCMFEYKSGWKPKEV